MEEKQCGFQPGESTLDAILVLRHLQEKFEAKNKSFPYLC